MHASQGTGDGQDQERIQRAGQEGDTSGHLLLTKLNKTAVHKEVISEEK